MKYWIANSEEWVVCEDYPSYMINREGQVKSSLTNKILKPAKLKTGYIWRFATEVTFENSPQEVELNLIM